jgi:hypothetical protein
MPAWLWARQTLHPLSEPAPQTESFAPLRVGPERSPQKLPGAVSLKNPAVGISSLPTGVGFAWI